MKRPVLAGGEQNEPLQIIGYEESPARDDDILLSREQLQEFVRAVNVAIANDKAVAALKAIEGILSIVREHKHEPSGPDPGGLY